MPSSSTGYLIKVEAPNDIVIRNPTGISHTEQIGVNGEIVPIVYTIISVSLDERGGSASFYYERETQSSLVPHLRLCNIEVMLDDGIIFRGRITHQNIGKRRVSFTAESIAESINKLPIIGSFRESGDFFPNSISILNEQGFPDSFKEEGKKPKGDEKSGSPSPSNDYKPTGDENKWTLGAAIKYYAKLLSHYSTAGNLNDFDFDGLANATSEKDFEFKEQDAIQNDFTSFTGITDLMLQLAQETNHFLRFNIIGTSPDRNAGIEGLGFYVDLVEKFHDTNKKVIDYKEDIYYDFSLDYDFMSPNKLYAYSGKRLVATTIFIDPKDPNLKKGAHDDRITIKLIDNGEDVFYSSQSENLREDRRYKASEILLGGKRGLVSNIFPTFKVLEEGLNIEYEDDFEAFFLFEDAMYDNQTPALPKIYLSPKRLTWRDYLLGVKKGTTRPLDKAMNDVGRINIAVSRNTFEIELTGFDKRDFWDDIKIMAIPCVIEVEDRVLAVAKRSANAVFADSITSTVDKPDDGDVKKPKDAEEEISNVEFDQSYDLSEVSVFSNQVPVIGVSAMQGYEGDLDTEAFPELVGVEDALKLEAERELTSRIMTDSSSISIRIPIEKFRTIGDEYPHQIGDWIDQIGPLDEGKRYAGNILPRPLSVSNILYRLNDVSITMT